MDVECYRVRVLEEKEKMQISVIGAGAVGCHVGGLLALAGHDVVLLGRSAHVDAINSRGLLLEGQGFRKTVQLRAVTEASRLPQSDLVLVCVKCTDTAEAGRMIRPALKADTVIVSLQNGMGNSALLEDITGRPVIPAIVYIAVEMTGPGHVLHRGGKRLLIGASDSSPELARRLSEVGLPTTVTEDIQVALWSKLVINCACNALSAVGPMSYGPLLEIVDVREVMADIVRECLCVAAACGISLPADMLEKVLEIGRIMPKQKSSMAQDMIRRRPTEIDFLNGYVVRMGKALDVPTPVNQTLVSVLKILETRHQDAG
ncbi:ketopantoate reductase family protein [Gluconobacter morbifer]|uniref:2-dehydropantoate 2-reductase n=1 Tax=Gluconobacter morbifer G707 TaxID=1088869 RepID=G6XHM2_9PROT|nr:2-dehydropantoate 2-reductase [Gluconobacter morbifer]EHH69680.1 2-dehydropantoate 2-reductase [Gluconobacter morbifer G707]